MMDRSNRILQALLDPAAGDDPVPWTPEELRAILTHQLALPLNAEINLLAALAGCTEEAAAAAVARSGCRTFGDLLREPARSPWLVGLLKRYAKAALSPSGDLPVDVARVLYVATLVRGRGAGIEGLTSLDDSTLEREAARCLTYGWLPGEVAGLLRSGPPGRG